MKEKPTVGSPSFGAISSDRIPKVTKEVNMHVFINNSNYTSELWELFEANTYSSEALFIFGCWHWNRFHNN